MNSIRRAAARAKKVHRELGLGSAADLSHLTEICVARGAFVREERLEGSSARLVVQGRQGIISITPTRHPGRRRFSIAHELGHFEMHRETQALWNCTDQDLSNFPSEPEKGELDDEPEAAIAAPGEESQEYVEAKAPVRQDPAHRRVMQEKEANAFAAELLMPERLLRASVPHGQPKLQMIQELSQKFEVSWLAMAYRYLEVVSEPCLLILRQAGNATPTLLRTPAFRRAGKIEILPRSTATNGMLSDWVRFETATDAEGQVRDSMIQLDTETKSQTGTQIDLLWAPELS